MDKTVVSLFFNDCSNIEDSQQYLSDDKSDTFLNIIDELNSSLDNFDVPPPVTCIYNSTEYARFTFEQYVRKYCNSRKKIMYFGMNPGPWGMSQTGVPFGEITLVRDWLGINGPVGKPPRELLSRPVKGFDCTRSEISGKRFWGLFKDICGTPENFFKSSFVYNYLPQQWLKESGCNVTPGDFKVSQMQELYDICDPIFCKVLQLYEVETVVAIGKFCESRAIKAIKKYLSSNNIKVMYMPHPSPRTVNNNNWNEKAIQHLAELGLLHHYTASQSADNT